METTLFRSVLIMFFSFLFIGLHAQSNSKKNSTDIGINITSILSTFVGNNNEVFAPDDYPLLLKLNRGKKSYRFGLGLLVNYDDELSVFEEEDLLFSDVSIRSRFGMEKRISLNQKFDFYYGLDLLLNWDSKNDVVSNVFDITRISEQSYGIGGGPVIGFNYNIGKRVKFGTEGSFYNVYSYKERKERFDFNPEINKDKVIHSFSSKMTAPVHLFILITL